MPSHKVRKWTYEAICIGVCWAAGRFLILHYPIPAFLLWFATIPIAFIGLIRWFRPYAKARHAREALARGVCPACAYDRKGLEPTDPCPECGAAPMIPPLPTDPATTGRPVCARCHGDMTGRETRTCPDFGAMYGIEYVQV